MKTSTMDIVPYLRISLNMYKGIGVPMQGLSVRKIKSKNSVEEVKVENSGKKRIKTYVYNNGKLFRKDSLSEAATTIGVELQGKPFQSFKMKGYHVFKDKENTFIFTEKELLPDDLRSKVDALEV